MDIKFSKLSLPSSGVALIGICSELLHSDNLAKFINKSPIEFTAKFGQIVSASHPDEHNLDLVLLVGLGSFAELTPDKARTLGGKISVELNHLKIERSAMIIEDTHSEEVSCAEISANIAFGAKLRNYQFLKYFSKVKAEKYQNSLGLLDIRLENSEKAEQIFTRIDQISEGVFLARDLISEPGNILYPESYAKICSKLAIDGLKVEVLGAKEMSKLGMNALLAVGQGSARESKLVVMQYNGCEDKDAAPLAFVGKGVCFDTGGISLKPSPNMDDMKGDMGGSAVVVGLMRTLAKREAKVNAVGIIGLVENMPGSNAQRPGDIVTSMSGQTIECLNTDAEGRMVLADCLTYAVENFKPKLIVDLATLTGAIVVSLSDLYAGLFSNNDELADQLYAAGEETGELLWRFPLSKEFDSMIDSQYADMQNISNYKGGGSITAAQFLQRFVGDTKWAHLDIAGVASVNRNKSLSKKGATGFGVRLLNELVRANFETKE
ncbi:MAG: leucyl aminopeptidase [Rickettsiales bacterium]|jgi:leucyl aminopeptidase|nr:leucyl aminopeptidase [Rickettsiales bacterium]